MATQLDCFDWQDSAALVANVLVSEAIDRDVADVARLDPQRQPPGQVKFAQCLEAWLNDPVVRLPVGQLNTRPRLLTKK